jgi:hypothetical protein
MPGDERFVVGGEQQPLCEGIIEFEPRYFLSRDHLGHDSVGETPHGGHFPVVREGDDVVEEECLGAG